MTVPISSYTNVLRVWKQEEKITPKNNLLGVTFFCFLASGILVIILSILFFEEIVQVDTYMSDDCMPQAMRKDSFIFINACEGNLQASFLPLKIPTLVICYLLFSPLLFPFLSVCPVLEFAQALLNSVRTHRLCLLFTSGGCLWRLLGVSSLSFFLWQDSVWTAGYSFHLWTHTPWVYCLSENHLLDVCWICSPSMPKRAEKWLFHLQKFLLERNNRPRVWCGHWRSVCVRGCMFWAYCLTIQMPVKPQFCCRETKLLLSRCHCPLDLPAPGGYQRGP